MAVIHVALPPRRPDTDPEPGDTGVPNHVFDILGFELADPCIGQLDLHCHGSDPPQDSRRDGTDRLTGRRIGEVSVFERGSRMIVPQQPAYGQDGFAMHEGDAGVGVS